MKIRECLTFDDVLLEPRFSSVLPDQVITESNLTNRIKLSVPILSAAMDTVTESSMAVRMAERGGVGVIHKNMTPSEQATQVKMVKGRGHIVGAAVGTSPDTLERARGLVDSGVDFLCLDTAHGHSQRVADTFKLLRKELGESTDIIVGNAATAEGARFLCNLGVDAVKVGIGGGSICTTRIVSGVGVPQFTAICDVVEVCDEYDVPVIADGGIRTSGDIVKALAAGASSVMVGRLLAGTESAPGRTYEENGEYYKEYRGMGSKKAMIRGSADRYGQTNKLTEEGVVSRIRQSGSVYEIVDQLVGGIKAGMGYLGAGDITSLQSRASFVRITNAGWRESNVHDVEVIQ